MEQSLINYVHRKEGPMPWAETKEQWCIRYANENNLKKGLVSMRGETVTERCYSIDNISAVVDSFYVVVIRARVIASPRASTFAHSEAAIVMFQATVA
jgi:hypothetical protein